MLQLRPDSAVATIKSLGGSMFADAILLSVDDNLVELYGGFYIRPPELRMVKLASELQSLPTYCAMADGRKWSGLPMFTKVPAIDRVYIEDGPDYVYGDIPSQVAGLFSIALGRDITKPYRRMREIVWKYYRRLMDDYENVGLLVREERGQLQVRPALRPKRSADTKLYYGPADKRRVKWFTVARDFEADVRDLEIFRDLIDPRKNYKEGSIHRFLAEAHHYLTTEPVEVLSHMRLNPETGKREFDFVLRPYIERSVPRSWTLVEIKRASPRLLSGLDTRDPILSAAVFRAANQLMNYRKIIDDPSNRDEVLRQLGDLPQDLKIAVLIGRRQEGVMNFVEEQRRRWCSEMMLVTYDDLYETRERALALA